MDNKNLGNYNMGWSDAFYRLKRSLEALGNLAKGRLNDPEGTFPKAYWQGQMIAYDLVLHKIKVLEEKMNEQAEIR